MDDTVLQTHNVEPALVQVILLVNGKQSLRTKINIDFT